MLNKYVNKTLIFVPIFTNLSIPGPSLWLYILHMILESSLIYERSLRVQRLGFLCMLKLIAVHWLYDVLDTGVRHYVSYRQFSLIRLMRCLCVWP